MLEVLPFDVTALLVAAMAPPSTKGSYGELLEHVVISERRESRGAHDEQLNAGLGAELAEWEVEKQATLTSRDIMQGSNTRHRQPCCSTSLEVHRRP